MSSIARMLISLPIIIVALVFAFVNNDLVSFSLWPFEIEITISFSVVVISLLVFGFIWGKISSWLAYLPLRKDLMVYKRQNKKLSKEHQKVRDEVIGLKDDIDSLKTISDTTTGDSYEIKKPFMKKLAKLFKSPSK